MIQIRCDLTGPSKVTRFIVSWGIEQRSGGIMKKPFGLGLTAVLVLVLSIPAAGAAAEAAFITSSPAMLTGVGNVAVKPLVTVGDIMPGGLKFDGIPDGIAVDPRGGNRFDIYVNHEQSTVPFGGVVDPINATVDRMTLRRGTGQILSAEVVISSSLNYQRFCSNFLAFTGADDGGPLLLTNEEATDFVNRTGTAFPGTPGEQAGLVVVYDPETNQSRPIYGMGRHNHENSVVIPAYEQAVILSGDDTFSAPSSQMYMYVAADRDAVWNDQGKLYGFVPSDPAVNDYGDIKVGDSLSGSFLEVPVEIAKGDQTGLESWSNANNVFQFIRIEDIAYDRRQPNIVYFADTGEPRAVADPATGRLARAASGTRGLYPNGRIFKMVLNQDNPLLVDSLSILIDADSAGYDVIDVIHQPDNIETTRRSLLIQEDPGGHNQYPAGGPGTSARIWKYDLQTGNLSVVARVNQSLLPDANQGAWESSGIVDASAFFGRGAFLVDIEAHGLFEEVFGTDSAGNTIRTEAGQLLLIRIPGA